MPPWKAAVTSMARLRNSARILKQVHGVTNATRGSAKHIAEAEVFSLEAERLFPCAAPVEVEIGAGKGDFIVEQARETPQHNFLAVELRGAVFRWLAVRCARVGLPNLRAVRADARAIVNLMLPAASVAAYHIYFPDPWPKSRHSKHRLFSQSLVSGLKRTLEPQGRLYLATDVERYFEQIMSLLEQGGFRPVESPVPGAGQTNFGRRFAAEGRPIFAGCFWPGSATKTIGETIS